MRIREHRYSHVCKAEPAARDTCARATSGARDPTIIGDAWVWWIICQLFSRLSPLIESLDGVGKAYR
jgi:hypothetical protein